MVIALVLAAIMCATIGVPLAAFLMSLMRVPYPEQGARRRMAAALESPAARDPDPGPVRATRPRPPHPGGTNPRDRQPARLRWRPGLLWPGFRLTISPLAEAYEIGEPITVRVTAVARRDSEIRLAGAWLAAQIWYRQDPMIFANNVKVSRQPPPVTVTAAGVRLSLPGTLLAGDRAECEAVLPNWGCAPSGKGLAAGLRVEYWLCARAVLGNGREVRCRAPLRLVSARPVYQDVEGRVLASGEPWYCDFELVLPVQHARPGDTLRGVFRVRPRQPVRARDVRVHLAIIQGVTRARPPSQVSCTDYCRPDIESPVAFTGKGFSAVTLARHVDLTGPCEFQFELQVPEGQPHAAHRLPFGALVRGGAVWYGHKYDMYRREINVHNEQR